MHQTIALLFLTLLALLQAQPTPQSYRLGPGDLIVLRVSNAPDISEKPVRIDSDGFIKLPMIGRLQAGGLTAEKLEAAIAARLKVYLEEPEVAVQVSEFHSQPVSILGAVGSPGVQQLQGRKTLVEMISVAGGLRADAAPVAKITRRLEYGRVPLPGAKDDPTGQYSLAEVDIKAIIEAKTPEKNILVMPEDVISVPKAEMVYILGDVAKVGVLPLTTGDSISALEALTTAGGALRTALPNKARILRPVPGASRRAELPLDLKKIQDGKADDVQLLAGDILFVPSSNRKRASARILETLVQSGVMVATYGIIR